MNIITSIKLDFGRETVPITVFAKQYDQESRQVEIIPLNDGRAYTLEAGITARIGATKPDGTTVLDDCTINDGKIYADLTYQMLAVDGIVFAEIGLYKGTALLSSQVFYINVKKGAYDIDAPVSSDEFNALVAALNSVETISAWVEPDATGATIYIRDKDGTVTSAHIDGYNQINSWDDIKYAVRAGLGPTLFPVGTEFTVERETAITAAVGEHNTGVTAAAVDEDTFLHAMGGTHSGHYEATFDGDEWHKEDMETIVLADYGITITGTPEEGDKVIVTETAGDITFVVRDHITTAVADALNPADEHYTYGMILEAKYNYSNASGTQIGIQFDAAEALFFCSEALPAGTYNFTWDYATGQMVNGTYQFTTTVEVPEGGQIVLGTNSSSTAITSCKISTYSSPASTTPLESNIVVTAGSAGTSLGTISASTSTDDDLNCGQRIMWGSNNYAQSCVRQWLNSDKGLGQVWTPTNKFDRPATWHTSTDKAYRGWMHGFGDDFLGAVLTAKVPCRTNSVFEVDSLDGTEFGTNEKYSLNEKFFLLSRPEIYGTWDSATYKDGQLLDYYDGLTTAEIIHRDKGGTARYTWLRSPSPGYANIVRGVTTDGSLSYNVAVNATGVAPACIIG